VAELTVVDYTPARDEDAPAGQRETYRVLEDTQEDLDKLTTRCHPEAACAAW
jgi:hypothetical protein